MTLADQKRLAGSYYLADNTPQTRPGGITAQAIIDALVDPSKPIYIPFEIKLEQQTQKMVNTGVYILAAALVVNGALNYMAKQKR